MKKHIANTTKFKLCVFFSHRACGTPYTQFEKSINANRKYVDSYDYVHMEGGKTITRHDLAYMKLIKFVDQHWGTIDVCILFMNDFENKLEIKFGYWDKKDFAKHQLHELEFDKQGANVICTGVKGGGIQTYPMRIGYVKQKAA